MSARTLSIIVSRERLLFAQRDKGQALRLPASDPGGVCPCEPLLWRPQFRLQIPAVRRGPSCCLWRTGLHFPKTHHAPSELAPSQHPAWLTGSQYPGLDSRHPSQHRFSTPGGTQALSPLVRDVNQPSHSRLPRHGRPVEPRLPSESP
jgi:hypothetical protein